MPEHELEPLFYSVRSGRVWVAVTGDGFQRCDETDKFGEEIGGMLTAPDALSVVIRRQLPVAGNAWRHVGLGAGATDVERFVVVAAVTKRSFGHRTIL